MIHHSDQGSQYNRVELGARCTQMGVRPSMGSVGDAYNNAMVHRWALKMLPVLATLLRRRMLPVGPSWRVDETYILVGGRWRYLKRAVDKLDQTVDFLLTAHRDVAATRRFFERAIGCVTCRRASPSTKVALARRRCED